MVEYKIKSVEIQIHMGVHRERAKECAIIALMKTEGVAEVCFEFNQQLYSVKMRDVMNCVKVVKE